MLFNVRMDIGDDVKWCDANLRGGIVSTILYSEFSYTGCGKLTY
jgi:hypothetical protein